jgi:xylulokinase
VLDVHAFLVQRLTGEYRTSRASADPMGLFDMHAGTWAQEILQPLGLSMEQMPQVFLPGTELGQVTSQAAQATGLPAGLRVIAGLGDGQAGGLGANVTQPGEAYLNLGTAVVSGTFSNAYITERAYRTHYGGIPGSYSLETVILGGTYTNRWFAQQFAPQFAQPGNVAEEALDELAREISPGAMGLLLVPYWNSVLNPYWDANASGIVVGWRGMHQPAHLYRAILEGIAFEQRLATEGVESSTGQTVERYIAFGGGARSVLWRQIMADVTGKRVYLAHAPEATALGAGILAAVAAGFYPSAAQAAQAMTRLLPGCSEPEAKNQAVYDRLYQEVYRHLYPALQPLLERLTQLSEAQEPA